MSRIGRKTEEIVRRGHEKRGTWSPKVGGAPLRRYQWWCKETGKYRSRENFCHYWRVVLIWAPLLRLRRSLTPRKLREIDSETLFVSTVLLLFAALLLAIIVGIAGDLWSLIGAWAILAAPLLVVGTLATTIGVLVGLCVSGEKATEYVKDRRHQKRMNAPASTDGRARQEKVIRSPKQRRVWPAVRRVLVRVVRPIDNALAAVWEYVVLVAQAIRVKKWKICPIVEIPSSASS